MALADRHYMRDEYHPPRMTTILIVVLIVAFVIQSLLLVYGHYYAIQHFGLTVSGLSQGRIWQIFTFQFLHAAPWPWHVLLNCLGLFLFGRRVEESLGPKKFLGLYFLSGLAGGLLQAALTIVLPGHPDVPVVGASAGVYGLMAIYCSMNPMQELTTWLYFLPITIRARYLLMFLGLFSLFGAFILIEEGIAHGAHLGGILLGVAYVRWPESFWGRFAGWGPLESRRRKQELVRAASVRGRPWRQSTHNNRKTERHLQPEEFISKEVDPILDKISAQGLHSLTESERKILEVARKRMK